MSDEVLDRYTPSRRPYPLPRLPVITSNLRRACLSLHRDGRAAYGCNTLLRRPHTLHVIATVVYLASCSAAWNSSFAYGRALSPHPIVSGQSSFTELAALPQQAEQMPSNESQKPSPQSQSLGRAIAHQGMFDEIRPTSKRPFQFQVSHRVFIIPENYFARFPMVGYLSGIELRVTFPGFKPYEAETESCFRPQNSGPHSTGCFTVEFYIDPPAPAGLTIFNRGRTKDTVDTQDRYGFETFHVGPKEDGSDYYKLSRPSNPVVVLCLDFPNTGGEGVCDDTFDFVPGITVRFRIYKSEIGHAVQIQDGLKDLVDSFLQPENTK